MATTTAPPTTAIRILEHGRLLDEPRSRDPEEIAKVATNEQALLDALYADRSRVLREVLQFTNKGENIDPTTLRMLALAAFRHLVSSKLTATVGELARSIGGEAPAEVLAARQACSWLLFRRALVLTDGGSTVELGHQLLEWFGGGQTKGPLVPTQEELGRAWWQARRETECRKQKAAKIPSAKELAARISQDVIGLDEQVRMLSCRMTLHLHRAQMIREGRDPGTPNEALLFIGDSGTGKTHTASAAGRLYGPFSSVNCGDLSAEGYVGLSVEHCFRPLLAATKGDAQRARFGIVFLDEIDGKAATDTNWRDIGGVSVQTELLPVLEGCEIQIGGRRSNFDQGATMLNTKGVMFILGGSFLGLQEILDKQGTRSIGFGGLSGSRPGAALLEALEAYGMLPALLNRLTGVVLFPTPSVQTLMDIAMRSVVPSYNRLLQPMGLEVVVSAPAVRLMAGYAKDSGTLARGIKAIMSRVVEDLIYNEVKGTVRVGLPEVRRAVEAAG